MNNDFKQKVVFGLLFGLFGWLAISSIVFSFRHPWATRTEHLLYIGKVLTFQKVDYKDARPRE